MATFDLRGGNSNDMAAADLGPKVEVIQRVFDGKLLRLKENNPTVVAAADVIQLVPVPDVCRVLAVRYEVTRINGAVGTFTLRWTTGATAIAAAVDAQVLAAATVSTARDVAAGDSVEILAVAALVDVRINVQVAYIPWALDNDLIL